MPTKAQLEAKLRRLTGGKKGKKKKTSTKKKKTTSKKKVGSGLVSYRRKLNNAPGVKAKTALVKRKEAELKKARAEKARVIKAARKKLKK